MPYKNEYASHHANQNAMSSEEAQSLLKSFQLKPKLIPYERLDKTFKHDFQFNNIKIKNAFVIDGSKYESVVDEKYSSKLALFNINQAWVHLDKLQQYLKNEFPTPQEYQAITQHHAIQVIFPTEGFSNQEYPLESDFFRFSIFKILQHTKNPLLKKLSITYEETLLGTFTHLFSRMTKMPLKIQPCMECNRLNHYMSMKDFKDDEGKVIWQTTCKCAKQTPVFLTDWLGLHLQLGNETSNEALTTQTMLILEKLTLINLIRNLTQNKLEELLSQSVFILDGSLAIYSHASWMVSAIHDELMDIKQHFPITLFSIEKTGSFVEHAKKVEHYFNQENAPIENQSLFAFNDDYIKHHIKTYDSDRYYGEITHFGKKLYYKNKHHFSFILNIAFESDEDKTLLFNMRNESEYLKKIFNIEEILWLLDSFSSHSYENAFSLMSFAHQGAALSTSELSKRLLTQFLQSLMV